MAMYLLLVLIWQQMIKSILYTRIIKSLSWVGLDGQTMTPFYLVHIIQRSGVHLNMLKVDCLKC